MSKKNYVRFKQMGDKKPVSFEIPLSNMRLPRDMGTGGGKVLKRVHYIKDAPSIWKDDYKGDELPEKVYLEDGYLDVSIYDLNLIAILKAHKMYKREYEIEDEDVEAIKELEKYDLIEKALERISIANEDERKANAFVLLGAGVITMNNDLIRSKLKKKAHETPQVVLDEMNASDYKAKYVTALGILRGALEINATRTAVTWADGKTIVTVATGQDPLAKMSAFLSTNTEEAKITFQEIGERVKQSYVKKTNAIIDFDVVDATDEDDNDVDASELSKATLEYKETFRKEVPNNKKNDLEWIQSKLSE
jgi:hypothetical protein